jgi:hypothetical protein
LWALYSTATDRPHCSKCFKSAVSFGLRKLNTYSNWLLIQPDVSLYAVATSLHPKLRLIWFETHWKKYPAWYNKAEKSIRKVFKQYIDAEVDIDGPPLQPPSRWKLPPNSSSNDLYTQKMNVDLHLLTNSKNKKQKRLSQLDEYFDDLLTEYTNGTDSSLELLDDPWAWWLQVGRTKYPILFKIATDYLSIPSTSCDCEHAFSKTRRTISDD